MFAVSFCGLKLFLGQNEMDFTQRKSHAFMSGLSKVCTVYTINLSITHKYNTHIRVYVKWECETVRLQDWDWDCKYLNKKIHRNGLIRGGK